mmetsp:Transcript_307/g.646  ORF Transcript_307/g.646 Transcript_307/m.646 type:complete len:329 (+) Transcript_307:136-1122(+)
MFFLRLMLVYRILLAREDASVLMTDTDVCYRGDMLAALDQSPYSIVMNGNADSINIGMVYGQRTRGVAAERDPALRFFGDLDRRLRVLRLDGVNSTLVNCKNKDVYWDQTLVNDVYHEWVAGKPITFRSCWLGFGRLNQTSQCFSDCCRSQHPFGLRPDSGAVAGTMGEEIGRTLRPHYKDAKISWGSDDKQVIKGMESSPTTFLSTTFGFCGEQGIATHENQCCSKLPHTRCGEKIPWMRYTGCWHSELDSLLSPEMKASLHNAVVPSPPPHPPAHQSSPHVDLSPRSPPIGAHAPPPFKERGTEFSRSYTSAGEFDEHSACCVDFV